MALFAHGLLPASYRGAPFAVLSNETAGGRRVALHQYPGRDDPWAEDMGKEARRWRFKGFIVDGDVVFAGVPIQLQRLLLIAALEAKGSGVLTHPTLGILKASVTRFSIGEDLGAGRMSSIDIEFVESGKQTFPSILAAASLLSSAAAATAAAVAVSAISLLARTGRGSGARGAATTTAAAITGKVTALGLDATALNRLTAQLPGSFSRFAAGGNAGLSGRIAPRFPTGTTVGDLVVIASQARATLADAAHAFTRSVEVAPLDNAASIPAAAAALVQALADACADPADALRLLQQLVGYRPDGAAAATPIGRAVLAILRRSAAAALLGAAAAYQPESADDASALIAKLGGMLDDLATEAADAGDDVIYKALRGGRAALVQDLRARSASLARITTFKPSATLPAPALAQRYYRDPARADQLLTQLQSRVVSPLFMPTEFRALAS